MLRLFGLVEAAGAAELLKQGFLPAMSSSRNLKGTCAELFLPESRGGTTAAGELHPQETSPPDVYHETVPNRPP